MQAIVPSLWFDETMVEAVRFYISVFPNSHIVGGELPAGDAPVALNFVLNGVEFNAIRGGPMFRFTEATSFVIRCKDQAEVDYYWDALTANGGEESQCGWLKDRFGLSWQVVPDALMECLGDPNPERAQRATQAMLQMRKIVIADLCSARDGESRG